MKNKPIPGTDAAEMRRRAEEQIKKMPRRQAGKDKTPLGAAEEKKLLHELEVHQIELEMQNDELLKSQAEVKEALERYSDLYDFAPGCYFTLTRDGKIRNSNLAGSQLLGVERQPLLGRRFASFVSAADRTAFAAFLEEVFTSRGKMFCELTLSKESKIPPSPEISDNLSLEKMSKIRVFVEAVVSEDGQECLIMVADITAIKQANEALRESEENFRVLSEAAFEAIAIHEEGFLINANDQYFKMFGYDRDETLGKQMMSMTIAPENIEFTKKQIATGNQGNYESIGIRKDKTRFPMEIRVRTMDYKGRNVRFAAIVDITARKQSEEALRKSEERYRMIFNNSPLGIMHFDVNGIIVDFNDKFVEIMGGTREKIIGFNMLEKLQDQAMLRAVKDAMDGRPGYYEGDYTSITAGKGTPLRTIYQRITDANGKFMGAVGIFEDITERKRAESQRETMLKEISKLNDNLEKKVVERTAELKETIAQLQEFNNAFMGRELRIIELKERIAELEQKDYTDKKK